MLNTRLPICGMYLASIMTTLCMAAFLRGSPSLADQKPLTIRVDARKPVARFLPADAFGGGIDGLAHGEFARIYQRSNVREMSALPFHRLSYRLRTELGGHVWHWNPEGTWSDPQNQQGYWTSSDKLGAPIQLSYGYSLPRRGNTVDQASNKGYSRLVDGDETTFWKTNPYLDKHFSGEDNALYPQWLLMDFRAPVDIQYMRVVWGEPHATHYEVQYWDGEATEYLNDLRNGVWRAFPHGHIGDGIGGTAMLRLADTPVRLRYIRVLLKQSAGTTSTLSNDVRDRLGFAIREIYAGVLNERGELADVVRHAASASGQTQLWTSSTDPWHRAIDRDPNIEQPGLDLIMTSGLARNRAPLMPTGLLYDVPENAQAQIRYLKARGYHLDQIELGEEPDGQNVMPEHYGALFIQFARAVKQVAPRLKTGGPGFQSEIEGWNTLPDKSGNYSWMNRFLTYLRTRGRRADFQFFSFEWYPFDNMCEPASGQLVSHPALFQSVLQRLAKDGVPRNIPWIITEYGYSSFTGQHEVELQAAVLNAEIVAQYVMAGIRTGYLYGLEPNVPIREPAACETWGNLMLFQADANGLVKWRLPTFHGFNLMAREWAGAPQETHEAFQAMVDGSEADRAVTAFAVRRPDRQWAVLILNKSDTVSHQIQVRFERSAGNARGWRGPLKVHQYSSKQYAWRPDQRRGEPERSLPPEILELSAGVRSTVTLPPMSMTVVKGPEPFRARKRQPRPPS